MNKRIGDSLRKIKLYLSRCGQAREGLFYYFFVCSKNGLQGSVFEKKTLICWSEGTDVSGFECWCSML